ncbi:MspA family porin [Nocardia sp. XZ_19_231]|uniref:MspA family porin n=1 Tax=Nocardia sp. XZ_19_231 TaxID=2769252 RepID=UPI00188F9901|nr:MspA family porin [Nocardia sp. XZ_19_231]
MSHKITRAAGVVAAAIAAVGLLSVGAANADTFVPLPGGEITETLADGTAVTVRIVGESALISPSMGATPLHRNTWVSARTEVQLDGAGAKGGKIRPGYVVGCQVNIAGGGVNGQASATQPYQSQNLSASGGLGGTLSLGPGQAQSYFILDLERADAFDESVHTPHMTFGGTSGSVTWKNTTIALGGCAGYAQARAFVLVEVETSNVKETVTLWGQPFSLG